MITKDKAQEIGDLMKHLAETQRVQKETLEHAQALKRTHDINAEMERQARAKLAELGVIVE